MEAQYFSVKALSIEDARLPITTTMDYSGLGFLDLSQQDEERQLKEGSALEVPLWLAKLLDSKDMANVEYPKHFNERFREHLEAGPASVNLREQTPHYFAVGEQLARYAHYIHAYLPF